MHRHVRSSKGIETSVSTCLSNSASHAAGVALSLSLKTASVNEGDEDRSPIVIERECQDKVKNITENLTGANRGNREGVPTADRFGIFYKLAKGKSASTANGHR
jgi:hypothetical protein